MWAISQNMISITALNINLTTATNHAETVKVVFDPQRISYRRLVQAFFSSSV